MELLEKGPLVVGGLFIRVEVVVEGVVVLLVDDDVVEDDGDASNDDVEVVVVVEDLAWRRDAVKHR